MGVDPRVCARGCFPPVRLEVVVTSGGQRYRGNKHAGAQCGYARMVLGLAYESTGSSEGTGVRRLQVGSR